MLDIRQFAGLFDTENGLVEHSRLVHLVLHKVPIFEILGTIASC